MSKHEPRDPVRKSTAWIFICLYPLGWLFHYGCLGAAVLLTCLPTVGGAYFGALLTARWLGGGVFAYLLGALIGVILGIPVTVLIGWFTFPFIIMMEWSDVRTPNDPFVASPNPVATGGSLTLSLSEFSGVRKVAFLALINDTPTLLGHVTKSRWGTWTLNLTMNLAPGSYTLLAQVWGERGPSRTLARQVTLTVQ
jgi:hypothetical protein